MSKSEIMSALDLRHNPNFRDNYLRPALHGDYVKITDREIPNGPKQKYRLTGKGRALKQNLENK